MVAPVIETSRLRLRGHRVEDLPACVAMWSDSRVVAFIGGKPSTVPQTWARLQAYVGHWALLGFGYWVIETRDDGAFVGEIGLADFKRDIAVSMRDVPEAGFALMPGFHGQGIASEALGAVLAWADGHLAAPRTVCLVHPRNVASLRVAEKCGYRVFADGTYNETPVLFLERFGARRDASTSSA